MLHIITDKMGTREVMKRMKNMTVNLSLVN